MQAIREIGIKKAFRFFLFSLFNSIYRILPFPQFRKFFLQVVGAKIGSNAVLMDAHFFNWHHMGPKGLTVGKSCFIGDETLIDLYDKVTLEDNVSIAQRVVILTHLNVGYKNHPLQKYFPSGSQPVVFKSGSVVGAGAIILSGVTVGEESMIGAGSVVTKNVPSHTLVAGVPAKIIRELN